MVPMHKEAKIITATLDRRDALKASLPPGGATPVESNISGPGGAIDATPAAAVAIAAAIEVAIEVATAAANPVAKTAPSTVASSATNGTPHYLVKAGDTLFSIAQRFGVSMDQIKLQNKLAGNGLRVGQTLTFDAGTAPKADDPNPTTNAALLRVSAPARQRADVAAARVYTVYTVYTVRAGDSLFAIAIKFGVDLDDLLRWNKLTGRTIIQPGLKIRVAA